METEPGSLAIVGSDLPAAQTWSACGVAQMALSPCKNNLRQLADNPARRRPGSRGIEHPHPRNFTGRVRTEFQLAGL